MKVSRVNVFFASQAFLSTGEHESKQRSGTTNPHSPAVLVTEEGLSFPDLPPGSRLVIAPGLPGHRRPRPAPTGRSLRWVSNCPATRGEVAGDIGREGAVLAGAGLLGLAACATLSDEEERVWGTGSDAPDVKLMGRGMLQKRRRLLRKADELYDNYLVENVYNGLHPHRVGFLAFVLRDGWTPKMWCSTRRTRKSCGAWRGPPARLPSRRARRTRQPSGFSLPLCTSSCSSCKGRWMLEELMFQAWGYIQEARELEPPEGIAQIHKWLAFEFATRCHRHSFGS